MVTRTEQLLYLYSLKLSLLFDLYCAGNVTTIVKEEKELTKGCSKVDERKEAQKRHDTVVEWLKLEVETDASVDIDNTIILPAPSPTVSDQLDDNLDLDDEDYVDEIMAEDIPLLYMD